MSGSGNDHKTNSLSTFAGLGVRPPLSSNPFIRPGLFSRPEVNNLYYRNQKLALDGYSFIGCRFDNCILEVSSTNFDLIRCVIDSTTSITYSASVLKIIRLFNGRYPWSYQHFPEFAPIQNPDGTITITDRVA